MDNLAKLKSLLAAHLGLDESAIKPESSLEEDLGADSLDKVELIMILEEEWGLDITDEESDKLLTVQDVLTYLEEGAA